MSSTPKIIAVTCCIAIAACGGPEDPAPQLGAEQPTAGRVLEGVPTTPDPEARYLIYLHGAIIEREGRRPTHPIHGVYEYDAILRQLAERGFTVISEIRHAGSAPDAEATKVAAQVRALLDAGVQQDHVCVVGFSKGGVIAALASSRVPSDDVGWVVIAGCGQWLEMLPAVIPQGRVLSMLDVRDDSVSTCRPLFDRMPRDAVYREIVLELGTGHGAFYRPDPAWIEPVTEWGGL
jgi:hypothetical protein